MILHIVALLALLLTSLIVSLIVGAIIHDADAREPHKD